jgi:Tfp pilus assembly protein PilF
MRYVPPTTKRKSLRRSVARLLGVGCLCSALVTAAPLAADISDPFDPFDAYPDRGEELVSDEQKTASELIDDAEMLMLQDRPLDARTKLLKALAKDPREYRAHINLANYYLNHVGHFRLALKYTKQAFALFTEKNGRPPYTSRGAKFEHAQLYFLLTHVRLNLDDYPGALQALDEFQGYGYTASWYADSRAWILMKLGRLEEATRIARLGLLDQTNPGRTLNMLGILLSMQHERAASLEIFRQAIAQEFALGSLGSPATPLNNSGEVFKEIFADEKAESAWLRATSLPDGCEHVLPSLNLALLYIEQTNFEGAKRAIDSFESCVAQFPLRNGEEHRALVHFARGRIALHTGKIDEALKHFDAAEERRQWFGKIGTSEEDLRAGVLFSRARALTARNNVLAFTIEDSVLDRLAHARERLANSVKAWWLMRRARQTLTEELANFEDIYVRNTDSMLEYPTLGELTRDIPTRLLEDRLAAEEKIDDRPQAVIFYDLWRAENYLAQGETAAGWALLDDVIARARSDFDRLLIVHARTIQLRYLDPHGAEYRRLTEAVFTTARAKLRNEGLRLPVKLTDVPPAIAERFDQSAFLPVDGEATFTVAYELADGEHVFTFRDTRNFIAAVKVRGRDLAETMNKLQDGVCSEELPT